MKVTNNMKPPYGLTRDLVLRFLFSNVKVLETTYQLFKKKQLEIHFRSKCYTEVKTSHSGFVLCGNLYFPQRGDLQFITIVSYLSC